MIRLHTKPTIPWPALPVRCASVITNLSAVRLRDVDDSQYRRKFFEKAALKTSALSRFDRWVHRIAGPSANPNFYRLLFIGGAAAAFALEFGRGFPAVTWLSRQVHYAYTDLRALSQLSKDERNEWNRIQREIRNLGEFSPNLQALHPSAGVNVDGLSVLFHSKLEEIFRKMGPQFSGTYLKLLQNPLVQYDATKAKIISKAVSETNPTLAEDFADLDRTILSLHLESETEADLLLQVFRQRQKAWGPMTGRQAKAFFVGSHSKEDGEQWDRFLRIKDRLSRSKITNIQLLLRIHSAGVDSAETSLQFIQATRPLTPSEGSPTFYANHLNTFRRSHLEDFKKLSLAPEDLAAYLKRD